MTDKTDDTMGKSEDAPAKTSRSKPKASTKAPSKTAAAPKIPEQTTAEPKARAAAPAADRSARKPAKGAKADKAEPAQAGPAKSPASQTPAVKAVPGKTSAAKTPAPAAPVSDTLPSDAKSSEVKSSEVKSSKAKSAKTSASEAVAVDPVKAKAPKAAAAKPKAKGVPDPSTAAADPADPVKPKSAKAKAAKTVQAAGETAPETAAATEAVAEPSKAKAKTAKAAKAEAPEAATLDAVATEAKVSEAEASEAKTSGAKTSGAKTPGGKISAAKADASADSEPAAKRAKAKPVETAPVAATAPAEPWAPATDAGIPGPSAEEKPKVRHAAMPRGGDAPLRRKTAVAKPAPSRPESAASNGPARDDGTPEGDRIAKAIARAGIASRRDAEAMIEQGRVTLNGKVLTSPAMNVTPDDRITVDGEPLPARERTRLWIYHKPRGLVTTARDPEGRQTVFDNLPEDLPRVVAIGRLDINTEGLLLLTNDGGLAKVIAHPDTGWLRRYRVRAHGDTTQAELDKLRRGVTIDGMDYGPVDATLDRASGDNLWLTLGLREGKNREVKRILEHLGLAVNRLIRLSFGPFQLGDLEAGLTEEIRTKVLKEQLGPALSEQAGVDFESPVREPIAPFGSPKQQAKQPARSASAAQRRSFDDEAPRGGGRPMAPVKPARVPTGGNSAGPRRSVWRAEDEARPEDAPRRVKIPRRGADPKAEREAAASRGRERVGAISTGERRVLVERLKSSPQEPAAEPHRRDSAARRRSDETAPREGRFPRAEAQARPFRQSDDRAAGPRPAGDRPARGFGGEGRPQRRDDDRPRGNFRAQDGAERRGPPRGSQDGAERRGPPRGSEDRPRGPFRSNANRAEGDADRRDAFRGDKPSGFRGNDRPGGERGGFKGARPDGDRGGFKGARPEGDRGGYKGSRPDGERGGFKGAGKPGGGFKAGGKPGGFGKPGGKPGGFSRGGSGGGKPGGARPPRGGGR